MMLWTVFGIVCLLAAGSFFTIAAIEVVALMKESHR